MPVKLAVVNVIRYVIRVDLLFFCQTTNVYQMVQRYLFIYNSWYIVMKLIILPIKLTTFRDKKKKKKIHHVL